jgi:nicotinamidase-related amidase
MTISAIDPETALLIIDLQNSIVAFDTSPPSAQVVEKACVLIDAFRRRDLPRIFVTVNGAAPGRSDAPRRSGVNPDGWADPVPELNVQPDEHCVTKQTWGAFTGTGLEAHLKSLGVTQVVIAGIATSIGVESTARQAWELGFNVTLAIDAMADMNADAHHNSLSRIFPRLGETGSVQDIIDRLP